MESFKNLNMKNLLVIVMFFATTLISFAGNNSTNKVETTNAISMVEIKGKVIDPLTNEALAGATVVVNGKKMFTDFDGNFKIVDQANKSQKVSISMISYRSEDFVIQMNETKNLEIALQR